MEFYGGLNYRYLVFRGKFQIKSPIKHGKVYKCLTAMLFPQDCFFKVNIFFVVGVTVMLSLTVFMNIVSELMPITSDAVPLVGRYLDNPFVSFVCHYQC